MTKLASLMLEAALFPRKLASNFSIFRHLYGQVLEVTSEERDIGVIMAKSMKPSTQCANAARTAQTVLSQVTRAFHYRGRNIFVRLYMQYVRPHLEFASPAWSPWSESDKAVLEKIQRRAINMVSGLKGTEYEERLKELGKRRHQADMLQTLKIVRGIDKVNSETWFQMAAHAERATRSSDGPLNFRQRPARLDVRRNFFSNRVVESWNHVPSEVKNARNVGMFKRLYQAHRHCKVPFRNY